MAKTFHKFSYLPFELRDSVWMEFLGEQPRQLYEFSLAPEPPALWHRVGMLYINPAYVIPMGVASRRGRTLSAVCSESRRLAHRIFPDTIEFYLPDPDQVSPAPSSDVRPTPSSSVLRYNALRDVISVAAELSDRQMFIDAHLSGDPRTPTYHGIRHLGISAMSFFEYRAVFNQVPHCPTRCRGAECYPSCHLDNFPKFVSLFPNVTHLYIFDSSTPGYRISRDGCFCNIDDAAPRGHRSIGPQKHTWPRIKGLGTPEHHFGTMRWEWFAIRDEDPECPFLLPAEVECQRFNWPRFRFPYYPQLSGLQVKFLQPLPVWRGQGPEEDYLGEVVRPNGQGRKVRRRRLRGRTTTAASHSTA